VAIYLMIAESLEEPDRFIDHIAPGAVSGDCAPPIRGRSDAKLAVHLFDATTGQRVN
jgi:hypothetical protein